MIPSQETATLLLRERLRLVAYYTAVTGEVNWGEEVFREVCSRAGERAEGFDSEMHLLNWARVAGRNLGMETVRMRHGEYAGLGTACLDELGSGWLEGTDVTSPEGLEAISRCISELDPEAGELLRLCFFEGLDPEEIARRKNLPAAGVRVRLAEIQAALLGDVHRRLASA